MKPLSYLLLPLLVLALAACDLAESTDEAASQAGPTALAHDPDEEEIANNLSLPVIWGDKIPLALGWAPGKELFDGTSFKAEGAMWFVQQDPSNKWQAESASPALAQEALKGFVVSAIDWKCNLETQDQILGQRVRVRVALYKDLDEPMMAYVMRAEDPAAQGCDRVWGSNGVSYLTDRAAVYSPAAHLVIQRLTKQRDDPTLSVEWHGKQWVGDVEAPVFSRGVWEASEEHGGFKAKVNREGVVMYHFNWETGLRSQWLSENYYEEGDYRLTIVLRDDAPTRLNTYFDAQTRIVDSEAAFVPDDAPDGSAQVQWRDNLTYLDIRLTTGSGGN